MTEDNNLVTSHLNRPILRDPLLESMRSHLRTPQKTEPGIEAEIDALLFGKQNSDPDDSYHPVTDIIPCLGVEVGYDSILDDDYHHRSTMIHEQLLVRLELEATSDDVGLTIPSTSTSDSSPDFLSSQDSGITSLRSNRWH